MRREAGSGEGKEVRRREVEREGGREMLSILSRAMLAQAPRGRGSRTSRSCAPMTGGARQVPHGGGVQWDGAGRPEGVPQVRVRRGTVHPGLRWRLLRPCSSSSLPRASAAPHQSQPRRADHGRTSACNRSPDPEPEMDRESRAWQQGPEEKEGQEEGCRGVWECAGCRC